MSIKGRTRHWRKSGCFIVLPLICLGLATAAANGAELDERQLRNLKLFVASDGMKPYFIEGFETEAIRTLIEQLKNETKVYDQTGMLFALKYSFERMKGLDPKLVTAGEAVVREKLKSGEPGIRELALSIVAVREKDAGLDRLVPFLNDPNESVRVTATSAFANFGSEARIAQLEAVLAERAKGLSAEEIKRDYVFRRGYAAIEKLKQRWRQPPAELPTTPPPTVPKAPSPSIPNRR